MGQFIDTISFFYRYFSQVLPHARKQESVIDKRQRLCAPVPVYKNEGGNDTKRPGQFESDKLCCFLFSIFPSTDVKEFLTFILSLYAVDEVLQSHRKKKDIRDEHEIRNLFSCLSSSIDPSRSCNCNMADSLKTSSKTADLADETSKENVLIRCNADQCRLQLTLLPSYKHAAASIKKYMQLYIDLQSYRHYPSIISLEVLKTWSSNHLKQYQGISCWEFCASADTFLGIAAMYAAASIPNITDEEIRLLDEACFPWLCGLASMLDSAINARKLMGTDELNFSSLYSNLKECEDRIIYFATQAKTACLKLKDSSLYLRVIKGIITLYISDPEINFSMLKLTASNISKIFSLNTYKSISVLMRCLHLL